MADYNFEKAWKKVAEAQGKGLPRTVTNIVAEIEREAVAERRWPTAVHAFLLREDAMRELRDEEPQEWLPEFAAAVDAQPAPVQAVLQLHLAHTYLENSWQWRWGGARPTKLDDEAAEDKMPPWSPEKINATLEAQFAKVFACADELKRQKLSDWNSIFNSGNMPEKYSPTLYDFAVRDAISFYGSTIPDKTLEKGIALYDRLIEFHSADGNVDARAMAEIDRAEYICEFGQKPEKERNAAFSAFLDAFMAKYGETTEVVAIAAGKRADMLVTHAGDEKLVEAHALASRYLAKWPKSPGGRLCSNVVAEIESKSLRVSVERNWCAPWPEIEVTARNVDEVHFRLVPISFKDLVADASMGSSVSEYRTSSVAEDDYARRRPAREWVERLPLKPDYTAQEFKFAVPSDVKSGHYVLFAAANDKFGADKLPLLAEFVTVTPLALVLQTGGGKFSGTVCRAESGEAVADAKVELWNNGAGNKLRVIATYTTDAEGRFAAKVSDAAAYNALSAHVRVVKDGFEVLSLGKEGSGSAREEKPNFEHVDVFTDRSIYRPGQEIMVKGIAYHANPHTRDFRTLPGEFVLAMLKDPNGKTAETKRLRTNRWGSFSCAFKAPSDRLTGEYSVIARVVLKGGETAERSKTVNVEEYKRPKFFASFEGAPEKAALGEPVTVTGRALTYSGLPVQHAKVKWHVERTTRYPDWWRWFGLGGGDDGEGYVAEGEADTDESGVFKVSFTPVAAPTADLSGEPSFSFDVEATVTDETGEARVASESFEIGTVQWRASVSGGGEWLTPGKPVVATVSMHSLAGAPVPVDGVLKVFRLKAPKHPVRKPAPRRRGGEKKMGPWDWKSWETGEEVASVEARTDEPEAWKTELKLPVGAYRILFKAKDPNGKTVKGYANVCVFDPSAPSVGLAVPDLFRVEKSTVKVGEMLRAYWSTGYGTGWCRVKVANNGKTVLEKTVGGENPVWNFELPTTDDNRGSMQIETMFVRDNRIYNNSFCVNVPWDTQCLDIKAEHMTKKLNPGREETWKFKVSAPAEVLAFMYDRSLDAYKWHDVWLGFSNYFAPRTPYLPTPTLENVERNLAGLSGSFPERRCYANFKWPAWKSFDVRYGMAKMKCMSAAGAGAVMEGSLALDCEVAPAAKAAGSNAADAEGDSGPDVHPRRNLRETAFFLPHLETDADGSVSFTFTVPDALTGWKFLMVAHDNALRGMILRNDEIVTTKPLMCEPNPPRFAREGDDFLFAVKVTNTEDEPQRGAVELKVDELGVDSSVGCRLSAVPSSPSPQPFALKPHESKTFEFRLSIPDGCGYLKYVAKAKGDSFADGEEGVLPVLSRRILVREAVHLNVRGDATKSFRFENLLASRGSDTIRHQNLTVRAVSRPAWYAVLSLPYLMEFPHECCEQTFSRYYANALGEFIANSDPRIRATFDAWKSEGAAALKSPLEADEHLKAIALEATPWVREAEHESAARARLGALFGEGRLKSEQDRCIEKLRLSRNVDGLWPWFPGGPSSPGIALYILTGFARLNHLAGAAHPEFFADAVEALDREVKESVAERLKDEKKLKIPFHASGFDVRWLYLHSFKGVPPAKNGKDAKLIVGHLRKEWTDFGLESQALAAIALKRCGEDSLANGIMASIRERGIVSEEMGMYWKRPHFFSSSVFAAPVSTQAIVVEAFREVTGDEESAEACNVWLLKQRETQDWTTTAATADAVYALMLGGGADLLAGDKLAEVSLAGEKVPVENAEKGTGMYSHGYAADAIRPEMGEITFTGAGEKGVAWGGVHWSYFEDVLKMRAHEPKELRVEKKYYRKTRGAEGTRLAALGETLEPGDEIVARLEIASDRTYEFVHLSDERPACAEPVDVLSSYRWRDGVGYYQSTKDVATHYYIDRLNKGVFVLETSYRVQQRGSFAGGLATIQCMYAPEFTAHSSAEGVRVGGLK